MKIALILLIQKSVEVQSENDAEAKVGFIVKKLEAEGWSVSVESSEEEGGDEEPEEPEDEDGDDE